MPKRITRGQWALVLVTFIGLSAIAYLMLAAPLPSSRLVRSGVPPDFSLPQVGGGTFTLSSYFGRSNVLLLFSEGLSCDPCMKEVIDLEGNFTRFRELNTMIVVITTDDLSDLTRWAEEHHVAKVHLLSDRDGHVSDAYGAMGADVSKVPAKKAGNTFVLVHVSGTVRLRVDFGPSLMSVPTGQVLAEVSAALF